MTARKELTDEQIKELERLSKSGLTRARAARAIGVDPKWIKISAIRTGRAAWLYKVFPPCHRQMLAFELSETQTARVRQMVAAGLTLKDMSQAMGCKQQTLSDAIRRAGIRDEINELRRQARMKSAESSESANEELLPRDTCAVFHWMTQPWRKAS